MSQNPYAPPTAKVEDIEAPVDPNAPRKRPVLVWIICLWTWFGLVSTPISLYWIVTSDAPQLTPMRGYYATLGPLLWVLFAIAILLSLAMSIQLFRLKRVAFTLATVQLTLGVVNAIVMPTPPTPQGTSAAWISVGAGIGFYLLVVLYVGYLRRKNVLR